MDVFDIGYALSRDRYLFSTSVAVDLPKRLRASIDSQKR
jgi:hypothetical protein